MEHFTIMNMISDGNLYEAGDTVPADSLGCKDCSYCCESMCDTIVIDPYDLYSMEKELHKNFSALINENYLEMGLHNLLRLPQIKNTGAGCGFLTEERRCGIYDIRPGICRLFPLGRYYHDDTFSYILQTHGCKVDNKGPVKISDWINIPDLEKYETYVNRWHYFIKKHSNFIMNSKDYEEKKRINERLLNYFYEKNYNIETDFYDQFYRRMEQWNHY